jgi:hypothetical protein
VYYLKSCFLSLDEVNSRAAWLKCDYSFVKRYAYRSGVTSPVVIWP